jgi:hypothetical protein
MGKILEFYPTREITGIQNKSDILDTCTLPALLYGAQTWKLNQTAKQNHYKKRREEWK